MKRNKKQSKISLRKIRVTKINDLSVIKGGSDIFIDISRSYRVTCKDECAV